MNCQTVISTYLDLFIALLAKVASSTGHFGTSHGLFFNCEVLLGLHLCEIKLV